VSNCLIKLEAVGANCWRVMAILPVALRGPRKHQVSPRWYKRSAKQKTDCSQQNEEHPPHIADNLSV